MFGFSFQTLVIFVSFMGVLSEVMEVTSCDCSQRFRIGAFNVKTFGITKMSQPHVAERIKEIVERYDVMLLQEIRDISGDAVRQLHSMLNPTDRILLLDTYQYKDCQADVFEREPFAVMVAPKSRGSQKLALIGLHAKPTDAEAEIGHLKDVIDDVRQELGADVEPIVLGDLNADCSYADYDSRLALNDELTTNTSYVWLISDSVDTTVKASTDCAYDRVIVRSRLASRVVENSALAFNFCDAMALTSDECYDVSDHYPVEMQLEF